MSIYFSELFWNLQYPKTAPLSYQYRQRTPTEKDRQDMFLNLSRNRIVSCRAVYPQIFTGCIHFLLILVNARYTSFS